MGKSKRIISTLNLKSNSFGDSDPLNRSLTVDEFESNLTSLGYGINNVAAELEHSAAIVADSLSELERNMSASKTEIKLDVKKQISELSAKSIKMVGSYKGLNLNPEEGEEQYIEFDEEGYYLITDILLTNSSAAVESASGGIFTSESMNSTRSDAKDASRKDGVEAESAKAESAKSSAIVAITSDYSELAGKLVNYGADVASGGGLSSLVDPTNFINTIVGGGSSDAVINRVSLLSASPGVSLISNSLVENGVYFSLSSPEGSDLTCDVYVFGFKIDISTAEETTTTTTEAEETTTTTTVDESITVSFLNQDANGPITSKVYDPQPIMDLYRVTVGKDGYEYEFYDTAHFDDEGILNFNGIYYASEYELLDDKLDSPFNRFAYKVYNRSQEPPYEKLESVIWSGDFLITYNGDIYVIDAEKGFIEDYKGIISRPIKEEEETTTTTTNNSIMVTFLNQDADGPISGDFIELYSVTANSKDSKDSKEKDSKESRFILTAIESAIFDENGEAVFGVNFVESNQIESKNLFAYKIYPFGTSELVWYGVFILTADGVIMEQSDPGSDSSIVMYDGVISRPIPLEVPVQLLVDGIEGSPLENVSIYSYKETNIADIILGIKGEAEDTLLGVSDANGIIGATISLFDTVHFYSKEFTDSVSSVPYIWTEIYVTSKDIKDGQIDESINLIPKKAELVCQVDNTTLQDVNGNPYPAQSIVIHRLSDSETWEEFTWGWCSDDIGNGTDYKRFVDLSSGTYKATLYENQSGGSGVTKDENGDVIGWVNNRIPVVFSVFWGEVETIDLRTPSEGDGA